MLEISNVNVYDLKESVIASGNAMRLCPVGYTDEEFAKGLERCKKLVKHGGGSGHTNFRTGIRVSFDMKYTQYITKQFQRYHFFDYVCSSSLMHRITNMDFSKCCNKYVSMPSKVLMKELVETYNLIYNNKENKDVYDDLVKSYAVMLDYHFGEKLKEDIAPDELLYDCYMRIISNCPMGTELFVRVSTNYEQLATIYRQRKNHKLKEDWGAFMDFIDSLPYSDELIKGDDSGDKKTFETEIKDFKYSSQNRLYTMVKYCEFADGMRNDVTNKAEKFYKSDRVSCLYQIKKTYEEHKDDVVFLSNLLRIIAFVATSKDDAKELFNIFQAGINSDLSICQESAVMVAEEWRTKECLNSLINTFFHGEWLKEYAEEVIAELEEELNDNNKKQ